MPDSYSLSPRRARIVRVAAALFMVVGLGSLIGPVAVGVRPGFSFRCNAAGCGDRTSLIDLAPEDQRRALAASAPARARFAAHVARPLVRAGLAAVDLGEKLPFALLMICVGLALRRLAERRGADLARALPWLRRAAGLALLMVVAPPVGASLTAMILYSGTPAGPMWYFAVEFRSLALDGLLALAVFAVVWAIDSGSRAERDMAGFV